MVDRVERVTLNPEELPFPKLKFFEHSHIPVVDSILPDVGEGRGKRADVILELFRRLGVERGGIERGSVAIPVLDPALTCFR
jgi:hypothetical protein